MSGVFAGHLRPGQHCADGEQRNRRGRIGEQLDGLVERSVELERERGTQAAERSPRHRVARYATQCLAEGRAGTACAAAAVESREGDAQRGGHQHVDHDGDDHRSGGPLAEQRYQQRHPMKPEFGRPR